MDKSSNNRIAHFEEKIGAVVSSSKKGKSDKSFSHVRLAPSILIEEKVWTCQSPPRDKTIKQRFSKLSASWRPRRMSVEIHQLQPIQSRILATNESRTFTKHRINEPDQGYQFFCVRMMKPRTRAYAALKAANREEQSDDDSSDEEDAASMNTTSPSESVSGYKEIKKSWKTKFKVDICDVELEKCSATELTITAQVLKKKKGIEEQSRTLKFSSPKAAEDFLEYFRKCKVIERKKKEDRFQSALGKIKLPPQSEDRQLKILIDIVSAKYLPITDAKSNDPYVIAMFGGKEIHRTKYVEKSLNPIWTIEHKSVFVLDVSVRELFEQPDLGLVLIIKDYDFATEDDNVGLAIIPPSDLYIASGQRIHYEVQPLAESKSALSTRDSSADFLSRIARAFTPSITLRCRHATQYDIDFLDACYNNRRLSFLHDTDCKESGGRSTIRSVMSLNSRKTNQSQTSTEENRKGKKIKKYRVRPSPDPDRPKETAWMTENDLNCDAMLESKKWINFGQEENHKALFGSLFVEVIKCDGLPNLDLGRPLGNKTDAFVTFVYGNNYGMSDVIDDKLSPRWPSWSRRAFIFHMMNPSQQLYVGVFDYDYETTHDLIGRVTVDLTNLRPGTTYTLDYSIKKSAMVEKHQEVSYGTITLRIRVDLDKPRRPVLQYLSWPEESFVNTKKKTHLRCIHKSINGEFDVDTFSFVSIKSHIRQLQLTARSFKAYSKYGISHVLLWRATMHLNIRFPYPPFLKKKNKNGYSTIEGDENPQEEDTCWKRWSILCTIPIPFHSILLCFTTFTLVDNIWLIAPYFFLWLGTILLSILNYKNGNSGPWKHCKTFEDVAENLFYGKSNSPHFIEAHNKDDHDGNHDEQGKDPILKEMEEKEEKRKKKEEKLLEIEEQEERVNEDFFEDVNLNTKLKSDVNPLKSMFYPIQVMLFRICIWLKFVENVVLWEESYISFILTFLCFFTAGVLCLVPWEFIFHWTIHIIVWIFFGPWMKLIDIFFITKNDNISAEEIALLEAEKDFVKRYMSQKKVDWYQTRRERLMKMGAFKKYVFGKYMVMTPTYKRDRYKDNPLRSSVAMPVPAEEDVPYMEYLFNHSTAEIINEGTQYLMGEIIPKIQIDSQPESDIFVERE